MPKIIAIAIDAMGGDDSPNKTLNGVKLFLDKNKSNKDFILNIFGKEKILKEKISKLNLDNKFINIINCESVVSDDESPLTAIKSSKNTSMWNCINHQLEKK